MPRRGIQVLFALARRGRQIESITFCGKCCSSGALSPFRFRLDRARRLQQREDAMKTDRKMRIETLAVHAGHEIDAATGAVATPIHLYTTFEADAEGGYPHGDNYGPR